jgi:hypothetical protein
VTESIELNMTSEEFLNQLPELFAKSSGSRISEDPRYARILRENPTCAELVRDLEYIAEQARMLLEPEHDIEPSPEIWNKIQNSLETDKNKID